jgi:RimJ/RimL family protein N-acetyltransferase
MQGPTQKIEISFETGQGLPEVGGTGGEISRPMAGPIEARATTNSLGLVGREATWTASSGSVWSSSTSRGYSDGRVRIRRLGPDDVLSLFAAVRESMEEPSGCMVWCHADYSIWDSAAFIRNSEAEWAGGRSYAFAILEERKRAFLGIVWLSGVTRCRKVAEAGLWVRTSRISRDVATAATRLIARFGFEELDLHRLELVVPIGSIAGLPLLERPKPSGKGQ